MALHAHNAAAAARYSRKTLWFAMVTVALLGACGLMLASGNDAAGAMATRVMKLFPILMGVGVTVALMGRFRSAEGRAELQALISDELRQQSMARGYRNAFMAVLVLQPMLGLATEALPSANVAGLMACGTLTGGFLALIATVLWYDR